MIDENRKAWLRGAYLDRIAETALALKKSIAHPIVSIVEKEAAEKLVGEYAYLSELTAGDQALLEEETVHELLSRLRDDRDYELRQKYGRVMMQARSDLKWTRRTPDITSTRALSRLRWRVHSVVFLLPMTISR